MQATFVDNPASAVHEADALIGRVMAARGYPESDYEQRSADISVDHAPILDHYRAAHEIVLRDAAGQANTEDLRQAVLSSHALFTEMVDEAPTVGEVPTAEPVAPTVGEVPTAEPVAPAAEVVAPASETVAEVEAVPESPNPVAVQ